MRHIDQLDVDHDAVDALRELFSEGFVAGGAFAHWLPAPASVPVENRTYVLNSARQRAVQCCLEELLRAAGLHSEVTVASTSSGDRRWPDGFVGSLTDKGTVVLGVLAPASRIEAIGVDLERVDGSLVAIEQDIAPEGLPEGLPVNVGTHLVFSAKESVFKAQFPTTGKSLDFGDVTLIWSSPLMHIHSASAVQFPGLRIQGLVVQQWVVTIAVIYKS